ncbi:hypothetical protein N7526_010295, partial [Penicillium atrosanguineum]
MMPFLFTGPGLKHLCLEPHESVDPAGMDLLKATWQSLIDTNEPKAISQLESVTVPSNRPEGSLLFKLATAGNLSQLRTLEIGCRIVNIAGLFPNLKRLFLDLNTRNPRTSTIKTDIEESITGILAFRSLEYLYIRGLRIVEGLDRIIQHHDPSLRGLALVPDRLHEYPRLHLSELLEMAIRCPNLEELRLQIRRSMGNQAECEIYKALSTLPNLQRLFLDLDFDARPKLPALGSHKTEDLDALRQTFINAAMDQSLALQIWSMIRNKSSRLKDLRLFPFGNQRFSAEECYLLNCFARSYLLTYYNLENPGVPVMEQIGKR